MNSPAALVLVDPQSAFCSPRGSYCRRQGPLLDIASTLRRCRKLQQAARSHRVPVFFTQLVYNPDYSDAGLLVHEITPGIKTAKAYARGSWDSGFTSSLKPLRNDVTISKTRYDPFLGTHLESTLRNRGVSQLVIAGVLTNVCVESCARSAFDRNFSVSVVADATTTYSAQAKHASLRLIRRHFGRVITTARALQLFDTFDTGTTAGDSTRNRS